MVKIRNTKKQKKTINKRKNTIKTKRNSILARNRIQKGGYGEERCNFANYRPDNSQNGMCYWDDVMGGYQRIEIYTLQRRDTLSKEFINYFIDNTYIWVILVGQPYTVYYSQLDPHNTSHYFPCMNPDGPEQFSEIHHNHIAGGKNVHCAGLFFPKKENGELVLYINNDSGHYTPDYECLQADGLWDALKVFRNLGYNTYVSDD